MNNFQSWYRAQPPALRAVLTVNVGFYVLWLVLVQIGRSAAVASFVGTYLALDASVPDVLYKAWGLVTYNFVHMGMGIGGLLHILFNMLWLVWIGREFEQMQGSHRFLAIYLIAGVGGGLLSVLFYGILPGHSTIVYGASASVLGIMAAVATFYPYQSIGLLFIGTVRLVWVVVGFLVLDIVFMADGSTAVAAHLGGALFGFLFARGEMSGMNLSGWARVFFDRPAKRRTRARSTSARRQESSMMHRMENWLGARNAPREVESKAEARSTRVYPLRSSEAAVAPDSEVDRILDKISASGYDSLSSEEKKILLDASKR